MVVNNDDKRVCGSLNGKSANCCLQRDSLGTNFTATKMQVRETLKQQTESAVMLQGTDHKLLPMAYNRRTCGILCKFDH